jgi:hypothetical protein
MSRTPVKSLTTSICFAAVIESGIRRGLDATGTDHADCIAAFGLGTGAFPETLEDDADKGAVEGAAEGAAGTGLEADANLAIWARNALVTEHLFSPAKWLESPHSWHFLGMDSRGIFLNGHLSSSSE